MTRTRTVARAPAQDDAGDMRFRDPDERLRLGLLQADAEALNAHARVDQDDHRPDFEEGEGEGKEIESGRHHQHGADAAADAERLQSGGQAVALVVQLAVSEVAVEDTAGRVGAVRVDDGQGLGPGLRHRREVRRDVDGRRAAHVTFGASG